VLALTTAWPAATWSQQSGDRVRRLGLLVTAPADDSEYPVLLGGLHQRLQELGWRVGSNLSIELRQGSASREGVRKYVEELVALSPDVIIAAGSLPTEALLQRTRSIPVVFTIVPDPVGAGLVDSLAQPGGNATGFASFEYAIGGKWLELLKEVAPTIRRVGVLRDSVISAAIGQWSAIQTVAPLFGVEVQPINLRDASDLERDLAAFASSGNGGLVVTQGAPTVRHRDAIVRLAGANKLPAIYYSRAFVTAGGLISYGANRNEQFRRAADYADRVLRGAKPADLPVQAPSKYDLVANLNTAKALGLTIPPSILARADEVIE
jgi:putative tryptophan/tyrosine transport system substrate-binding protein